MRFQEYAVNHALETVLKAAVDAASAAQSDPLALNAVSDASRKKDKKRRLRKFTTINAAGAVITVSRFKENLKLPPALHDFTPLQNEPTIEEFLKSDLGTQLASLDPNTERFTMLAQQLQEIYAKAIEERLECKGPGLIAKSSRVVLSGSHLFSKVYTSVWKLIVHNESEGLGQYQESIAVVIKDMNVAGNNKKRHRQRPEASKVTVLFQDAAAAKPKFDEIMRSMFGFSEHGLSIPAKLKNVHRVIEKCGLRHKKQFQSDKVCDVVRGMVITASGMSGIAAIVAQIHDDPRLIILRVKDRFLDCPSGGGWRDLMLNVCLRDDSNRHVCEIQIVHPQLYNARAGMPGHKIYGIVRNAGELLERFMGRKAAAKLLNVNAHNEVHTFEQELQVKRSGVLSAPWVPAVNEVLSYKYHEDIWYLFPHDVKYLVEEDCDEEPHAPLGDADKAALLNGCPVAFDSVWYIAALSKVPVSLLGDQLHAGLVACLSSATQGHDRFIAQMAVIAIGWLHRGSRNGLLSRRLLQVWENHEISNVRVDAALSLQTIAHPAYVALLRVAQNLPGMQSATDMATYFEHTNVSLSFLDAAPVQDLLRRLDVHKFHHNAVVGALVSICLMFECEDLPINEKYLAAAAALQTSITSATQVEALLMELIDKVRKLLSNPYVGHLIKTFALESITRAVKYVRQNNMFEWKSSALANAVVDMADRSTITSVFKSVRTAANELLQGASFELMGVYACFGSVATARFKAEGFVPTTAARILEEHLLPDQLKQLRERVNAMSKPLQELEDLFIRPSTNRQCRVLTEDPTLLLYTLVADYERLQVPFNASFLQHRLNSVNKLERYIGLVCIGCLCEQPVIAPLLVVVPLMAASEMISDVRDLAVALAALKEPVVKDEDANTVTSGHKMLSLMRMKTKLIDEERNNLQNFQVLHLNSTF